METLGAEWSLARRDGGMTYGVMFPHFGANATPERVLGAARLVERLGFDAIWCRDHLLWKPHTHEGEGKPHAAPAHTRSPAELIFVEPMVTLAAAAAVTDRIQLGTSVLVPLRYPAKAAQELTSLSYLSGGRVVAGIGAGHDPHELEASGMPHDKRRTIVEETIDIFRGLWNEDAFDYDGEIFKLDEATLRPRPLKPIPILYGGPSKLAVRIAAERADGWLPGVVPFTSLDGRIARYRELTAAAGKQPRLGVVPRTSIDRDRDAARKRAKVDAMISDGIHHWEPRDYATIEDLRGALLTGTPEEVAEQVLEFAERGFDHFVFDIRWQFERFEDDIQLIAEEVLPALRRASAAPAAAAPA